MSYYIQHIYNFLGVTMEGRRGLKYSSPLKRAVGQKKFENHRVRRTPFTNVFHDSPQIISAAQTLALHPSSKIARENLEVFCEAWDSQLCDMALLLREINDVFEGRRGVFLFSW